MKNAWKVASLFGAIVVGVSGLVGTASGASQVLLSCASTVQTVSLNPPMGSGTAKYYKSVGKAAPGGQCLVDAGISTPNPASDSTKPNPYANETNGHSLLHVASSVSVTDGVVTCNTADPSHSLVYPAIFPGNGKVTTKFVETNAAGLPLTLQAYIRLGKDPADPVDKNFVVSGIVIKGVGQGGDVHAVVNIGPDLASTKNVNLLDCLANPAVGNASIGALISTPADGSDPDTAVDPWTVTLP